MGWGALQWLRATKESTYGTYDSGADPADIAWFRLAGANAFGMRVAPQRRTIRSADGGNRRRQQVAARKVVTGRLNTLFYPSQAEFVLNAALGLAANDLPSYTLDYFDSVQVHRFLGAKVGSLALAGSADADNLTAGIDWTAQKRDTTTLAQPMDTVFPTEVPYEHVESKGLLSIGGVTTKYSQLNVTITNVLAPTWDEDVWITNLYYAGRNVDLTTRLQYVAATMRTAFEAQTSFAVSAAWLRAAGLKTTLDLKGLNFPAGLDDDLPLDGATYQTLRLESYYDQSATTDCSYAVVDTAT